jgi:crotonobetainyl-CoA:carnitine CoA-transferase CaiB-like acyl-CoA transferase
MDEARPFAGIEVVEFGQFIAVPFCGQLLAEGGAHVLKVESLDGDPVRHLAPLAPGETRHFISRNRGKHSLPLDLKHRDARRIIDALLARADVVLFNFRPGLAEELGLDYASLARSYPRLIVGSVTGFGTRGPDAGLAGMDLVLQARSGLMASNGRVKDGVPSPGDQRRHRAPVSASDGGAENHPFGDIGTGSNALAGGLLGAP